ncbi:MAG TPA: RIP metalloprotease [Candidatus Limnocylindrales bacterium]|jgi:regulator of sigma E protease
MTDNLRNQQGAIPPDERTNRLPTLLLVLIGLTVLAAAGVLTVELVVTLLLFAVVLGVTVLIHELGHFVAARLARVRVLEFGVGFPPRAKVLRDRGDTVYTLNWLPIGGFVKLEGEDGDDPEDPRSFSAQRLPIKVLILAAGVVMNLLLSFAIFAGIALTGDPALGVYVPYVDPSSPAQAAGIVAGDTIERVDGRAFSAFGPSTVVDALSARLGKTVSLTVLHPDGTVADVQATLRSADEIKKDPNLGALGVGKREVKDAQGNVVEPGIPLQYRVTPDRVQYPTGTALNIGLDRTVAATQLIAGAVGDLVGNLVTNPTQAPAASGPIGIAAEIGNSFFTLGPIYTLFLTGLISANLAVVNILPMPPLDGGRILVIVLKSALRGRLSLRAERLTYVVGFALLIGFMLWVSVFDVARQLGGGQ